jgi:uncharacterized membrane protein
MLRNPQEAQKVVARVVAISESFSGPMPHPKHLRAYEEIAPGSANTMLKMAEREQVHRHKMQTLEMVYPYLGWFAGFVGLLACLAGAYLLAMAGHEGVAGGMLGVPALGVVGWFIKARLGAEEASTPPQKPQPRPAKRKR